MMRCIDGLLLALGILFAHPAGAQNKPLCFKQNKGQVLDQYGGSRSDILYMVEAAPGLSMFIGNGELHYQFSKPLTHHAADQMLQRQDLHNRQPLKTAPSAPDSFSMYRMDVTLEGHNPHSQVITEKPLDYLEHYYTPGTCMEDAAVYTYEKIILKDIYPNIDWVFYIKDNHVEYDFIVHPGGDPDAIHITYKGATQLQQQPNGAITATTPMGSITESNLYAYKQEDGSSIDATYQLEDNTVRCRVPDYTGTLVLDPWLDWGTYFGGSKATEANGVICDTYDNLNIYGLTVSNSLIATIGAYQDTLAGDADAFIAQFTTEGLIRWGTYYGGMYDENPYGFACDTDGNIFITGWTNSTNKIATAGSYIDSNVGRNFSGYLAKFDKNGALDWGTFLTADSESSGYAVACDNAGNVYISGGTNDQRMATTGTFQDSCNSTHGNVFMACFTSDGMHKWGTFFGDIEDSNYYITISGCTTDGIGGIYLAGSIAGNNMYVTPHCYQDSNGSKIAGSSGYIAKFDTTGNISWCTYYGGDTATAINAIVCNNNNDLIIAGATNSANGIATTGAWQDSLDGDPSAIIATFSSNGSLQWSTYYGGSVGGAYARGVTVDHTNRIYLTGTAKCSNNVATTNGYKNTYTGGLETFASIFSSNGLLEYGSYYGCNGAITEGLGIATDSKYNFYVAGLTDCSDSIATSNAYQDSFYGVVGMVADAFLLKFDTAATGIKNITQTEQNFSLSPNPNHGNFAINGTVANDNAVMIAVYNMLGQVVVQQKNLPHNGKLQAVFSAPQLLPGVYLVQLSNGAMIAKLRMVVE